METNNDFERYAAPVLGFQKGSNQAIPLWGLYNGKSLTGTDGIFAPMLKHFLESALQGELASHLNLGQTSHETGLNHFKSISYK